MTGALRVLVADDEPFAREKVRTFLEAHPDCDVIAEAGDGGAALALIRDRRPDLVFLDVQMPELDGFEVLEALGDADAPRPVVVFTTAYDRYAIRAFEVRALDYLLKPFDRPRFEEALARAREVVRRDDDGHRRALDELLRAVRTGRGGARRLLVQLGDRLVPVPVEQVEWIEADGNNATLWIGGAGHAIRESLKRLEERLDPERFVRIHRSTIVQVDRVAALEPWFHGELVVTMRDGRKLRASRTHAARLRARLEG